MKIVYLFFLVQSLAYTVDKKDEAWNTVSMKNERLSWIDVARGIGILLVIYGHGLNGDSIRYFLYSFHMPLFFFLSGIVYHHRAYETFNHFFIKTAKRILVPYFVFALASYILWLINAQIMDARIAPIPEVLLGILYGNGNFNALSFNVVLWFLPCLFVTKILFALLTYVSEKKWFLVMWLFIFSLLGYAYAVLFPTIKLPFGTETALTAVVFFGTGYLWNGLSKSTKDYMQKNARVIFIVLIVFCAFFAAKNYSINEQQIDLRLNRLNNYFYFYLAAMLGIISSVALSMWIGRNKTLEYLGKHSLQLFIWHLVVFSYLTRILRLFLTPTTIDAWRNLYLTPMYTVVSITVILFLDRMFKKVRLFIPR